MIYKVSVIVPVYNTEKYISICIQSLLDQTLDSLEIILLDDGSSDQSGQICDQYALKHKNICVYHLENGGPSRARNIGLQKAKGKYIGFVDSDDYVEKDMFFSLYEEAEKRKSDVVMCSYAIDNGESVYEIKMNYKTEYQGHVEIVDGLCAAYSTRYHNGLYSVWNKLFSSDFLIKNQLNFDEELIRAEDAWFVLACLKVANKVSFTNKILYKYRQVSTSTMHTFQQDRYMRSKEFRKRLEQEDKKLGISIDYNEFYYEFLYETFVYCRAMVIANNINIVRKILNDSFFFRACQYNQYLPAHLKWMSRLEQLNCKWLLLKVITIWSKLKRI